MRYILIVLLLFYVGNVNATDVSDDPTAALSACNTQAATNSASGTTWFCADRRPTYQRIDLHYYGYNNVAVYNQSYTWHCDDGYDYINGQCVSEPNCSLQPNTYLNRTHVPSTCDPIPKCGSGFYWSTTSQQCLLSSGNNGVCISPEGSPPKIYCPITNQCQLESQPCYADGYTSQCPSGRVAVAATQAEADASCATEVQCSDGGWVDDVSQCDSKILCSDGTRIVDGQTCPIYTAKCWDGTQRTAATQALADAQCPPSTEKCADGITIDLTKGQQCQTYYSQCADGHQVSGDTQSLADAKCPTHQTCDDGVVIPISSSCPPATVNCWDGSATTGQTVEEAQAKCPSAFETCADGTKVDKSKDQTCPIEATCSDGSKQYADSYTAAVAKCPNGEADPNDINNPENPDSPNNPNNPDSPLNASNPDSPYNPNNQSSNLAEQQLSNEKLDAIKTNTDGLCIDGNCEVSIKSDESDAIAAKEQAVTYDGIVQSSIDSGNQFASDITGTEDSFASTAGSLVNDFFPDLPNSNGCGTAGVIDTTIFGRAIYIDPCSKLAVLRDVLGWVLYVLTAFYVFKVAFKTN